ncbi:MAG: tetratricopeptide repeat protein [Anaerolineae bacterium]|nr:tetratricopeptide repeat protein [Anaerolineae bacterium]
MSQKYGLQEGYEQVLGLFRQVGARLGEANVLLSLGDLERGRKQYPLVWHYYQSAGQLYQQIGDGYSLARVLYRMGDWWVAQAQPEKAVPLYEQAITIWSQIGLKSLVEQILRPKLQQALLDTDEQD